MKLEKKVAERAAAVCRAAASKRSIDGKCALGISGRGLFVRSSDFERLNEVEGFSTWVWKRGSVREG